MATIDVIALLNSATEKDRLAAAWAIADIADCYGPKIDIQQIIDRAVEVAIVEIDEKTQEELLESIAQVCIHHDITIGRLTFERLVNSLSSLRRESLLLAIRLLGLNRYRVGYEALVRYAQHPDKLVALQARDAKETFDSLRGDIL